MIESLVTFSRDDRLGWLTFCPTNLGTTIRASVHIKIPKTSARDDFAEICREMNLQIRGKNHKCSGEDFVGEGVKYLKIIWASNILAKIFKHSDFCPFLPTPQKPNFSCTFPVIFSFFAQPDFYFAKGLLTLPISRANCQCVVRT